jgi:arylformamidase
MRINFAFNGQNYHADLGKPINISLRLHDGFDNPNCFWASPPAFEPVRAADFVGSTALGGLVNFFDLRLNPHGNGTHTECVGHISKERFVLPDCLVSAHFFCKLISIYPQRQADGDRVIELGQLQDCLLPGQAEALIIRTLPNDNHKQKAQYSGANPPYLHAEAVKHLVECGIQHLLVDLPSVDREVDGGALAAHRAFWQYPENIRSQTTITELIYVPSEVPDGHYLLNIQTINIDLDVSPSKPQIFALSLA